MSQSGRLAAILAADVAGYSRLIGADESGTLEALKAIRAELNRMLAIDPNLTIAGFRASDAHFQAPDILELYVTGLRLAGLPE